jgi:hypothetical protein
MRYLIPLVAALSIAGLPAAAFDGDDMKRLKSSGDCPN